MDHIKTTQADCKWAWEQTAGSGAGTEWWLGEARSQQASDQTLRFNISNHSHCLEPQRGVLWDSSGFFSLIESSCDWQLSTLIDTEGTSSPLRGGRQANWLCSSCLMAGYRRNCRPASRRRFSPQIDGKWWILSECFGSDAWAPASQFSLCLSHKHVDVESPPLSPWVCRAFFAL